MRGHRGNPRRWKVADPRTRGAESGRGETTRPRAPAATAGRHETATAVPRRRERARAPLTRERRSLVGARRVSHCPTLRSADAVLPFVFVEPVVGAVRASPPVRARLFPRHLQIASLIALRSDKSFSGFRRLFDAGKKCTVTPRHAATPRRFTIFCVSVSRTLSWRFCSLVFGSRRSDVHRPPLSHSHHTTFHTKRNNGCFRRYHPLPLKVRLRELGRPRGVAPARTRRGRVPIGAIALRNTREKKPYPLRSRPGTRARGRERRHDAETNVTARRALTFCPVDAFTG